MANEIEKRIKEKLGVGPRVDADAAAAVGNASAGPSGNESASNGSAGNRSGGPTAAARGTVPGVTA